MNPWQKVKMPALKVPPTKVDWLLEGLALTVLVFCIGMTVSAWNRLPAIIPTHFDISGQINGRGSRNTVLSLLPVVIGMYTLLSITTHFPRAFNYLVEITEKNAAKQYGMAKTFSRLMKLEITLMFASLEFCMIRSAINHQIGIGLFALLGINLAVIIGTVGHYASRSQKAG